LYRRNMMIPALLAALGAYDGRPLHWVIRVSDLEATLNFTKDVLGMHVLRHEENEEACPITCNGRFNSPWSKTMVGYNPEDSNYALELTYNYAIKNYMPGVGLRRFTLSLPEPDAKISKALEMGYAKTGANGIIGPDGYVYELRSAKGAELPEEPFMGVVLRAKDAKALGGWYSDLLGMQPPKETAAQNCGGVATCYEVGYEGGGKVKFFLAQDGVTPTIQQWEGRNAIALPEQQVRALNTRLVKESPELVVHELMELHEKLGILVIVIIKDPLGYELCIVSSETFDPSVKAATDYSTPKWDKRAEILAALPPPEEERAVDPLTGKEEL